MISRSDQESYIITFRNGKVTFEAREYYFAIMRALACIIALRFKADASEKSVFVPGIT